MLHGGKAMLCLTAALLMQALPQPVIRVQAPLVILPTSVLTKDGRALAGLERDDFRVYDNGRIQTARLDVEFHPLSVVIAVETSLAVREHLPHIRRVASALETWLIGQGGEAAVVAFNDEIRVSQPFTSENEPLDKALQGLAPSSAKSRTIDAVLRSIELLRTCPPNRRRILLLIAQAGDAGSSATLREALAETERNDVRVFALVMPRLGKVLISEGMWIGNPDSLSKHGRPSARGGIAGSIDLGRIVPEIYRGAKTLSGRDAVTVLTSYTGGRPLPFRKLRNLEDAIASIGEEIHSEYVLSYAPDHADPGYHRILVEVAKQKNAVVHTRPGYFVTQ